MNFSNQLKKYRELHGFSQEILAEKICLIAISNA